MIILIILALILDGIIIYFIPNNFNNIIFIYPMLTVSIIPFIHAFIKKKNYLKYVFIIGIIYDLLYYNIFLYNAFIFLFLGKINNKYFNICNHNYLNNILIVIINIIIYDLINFIMIYITKYSIVTFNDLFYKIYNSFFLNILVIFVLSFIDKKYFLKHKIKW